MRIVGVLLVTLMMAFAVAAQRPRDVKAESAAQAPKTIPPAPPQTMKAKYEGGVFGYNKTQEGTLSFDDANSRLLFRDKKGKEVLFVPYNAVLSTFSDTQKRRPSAATVAQHIPYIGFPIGFIKTKVRYLTLQFKDPDTDVSGVTSFRLDNKDLVDSVVYALANKAGLVQRGEIWVRKTDEARKVTP